MRPFLFLFLSLFLFACNNAAVSDSGADSSSTANPGEWNEVQFPDRSPLKSKEDYYVWEVDIDNKTLQKNPLLPTPSLGVDTLIMGLNERFPKILLEKQRISHDTLYTEIKNADFLTDQMGSHGAEQYIAYAILNLTSAPGIHYVKIDFTEGSHASPDVWSKESFAGFKMLE